MPPVVLCPNPACGARCAVGDGPVRCPKCGKTFAVRPTLDGRAAETNAGRAAPGRDPFPSLPAEFGRYRVLKRLGRGGMGVVYLAEDTQLGRQVALKLPTHDAPESPQRAERFVREARAAAALQHPNVCTVFDAGHVDGRPFMTMAYVEGHTLSDEIGDEPMPPARAAEIARKVALALEHAHRKGIVHRDLKPANVMLTAEGEPVVMDFGLAKRVAVDAPGEAKLTRLGAMVGTPHYASPEQVRGERDVGPATDTYSLGVMLFEMLTGRTPYAGSGVAVMGQIMAAPVPSVADVVPGAPPRLVAVCLRAMAKEPADRFAGMAAFAEALIGSADAHGEVPAPRRAPAAKPRPAAPVPATKKPPRAAPPTQEAIDEVELIEQPPAASPFGDLTERPKAKRHPASNGVGAPVFVAAAMALVAALILGGSTFLFWPRFRGEGKLLVVANDEAEARLKGGQLVLVGPDGPTRHVLAPGERSVKLKSGSYNVLIEDAEGLTAAPARFYVPPNGGAVVQVTWSGNGIPVAMPPPPPDVDRQAAEFVISLGGKVSVNDELHSLNAVAALPASPFRLTTVNLNGIDRANDAAMARLKGCRHLTRLFINKTSVTDAGMAHVADCANVTAFTASKTQVTDVGLFHLRGWTKLDTVGLSETGLTDAGVPHFAGHDGLLAVSLAGTAVTDAGAARFEGRAKLAMLDLGRTKVSAVGVANLKKALPKCDVLSDAAPAAPPQSTPDRRAALYVLSIGGKVRVSGVNKEIASADDLPAAPFTLWAVDLLNNKRVTDAGLASFAGCKGVTSLTLQRTPAGDAGLVHFRECKGISVLNLWDTRATDVGLAHFADCKSLGYLRLDGTKTTDAGLAYFKDRPHLFGLCLGGTKVTPAGLAHFSVCKNLTSLNLQGVKVGDAALVPFKDCKRLRDVWLGETLVGNAGLANLKGCQDLTILSIWGTRVTNAGLKHFEECKNLKELHVGSTKVTPAGIAAIRKLLPGCKIS